MRMICIMVIAMTVAGCGKTEDGKESKARTITRDVTETVTGYRAIKHGQQAQDRIRKIDAEHKARNDAILNDM